MNVVKEERMNLMSSVELENILQDLKKELNYTVERKIQQVRDSFEREMTEMEKEYSQSKLSDL